MGEKAVEEKVEGTTPEAEEQAKVASSEKGEAPESLSKVSPKEEKVEQDPKLYSQREIDTIIHAKDSEHGRVLKDVQDELDETKNTISSRETDVEDIQEERDGLQTEIDDLTSSDPQKWEITKKRKELVGIERDLKKATADLAIEQKAGEERIASADATLLEIDIWDIANEFTSIDPVEKMVVKLKNLLAKTTIKGREGIREFADNLWEKKSEAKAPAEKDEGEEKEKLNLDSGESHGGGELSEQDRLDKLYPSMKKK